MPEHEAMAWMTPGLFIEIIVLVIFLMSAVATAVWAVGKINAHAEVMRGSIDGLTRAVTKLDTSVNVLQGDIHDIDKRVALVERANHGVPPGP